MTVRSHCDFSLLYDINASLALLSGAPFLRSRSGAEELWARLQLPLGCLGRDAAAG